LQRVKFTINGKEVEVPVGSTILQAAEMVGIDIPRLCYDPDLSPQSARVRYERNGLHY
jgi:NADH-quinone oxidoreductase subunit G